MIKGLQGLTPVVGLDFRGLIFALPSVGSAGRCFGFGEVEAEGVLELEKCHKLLLVKLTEVKPCTLFGPTLGGMREE